jgi:hypothetical protein
VAFAGVLVVDDPVPFVDGDDLRGFDVRIRGTPVHEVLRRDRLRAGDAHARCPTDVHERLRAAARRRVGDRLYFARDGRETRDVDAEHREAEDDDHEERDHDERDTALVPSIRGHVEASVVVPHQQLLGHVRPSSWNVIVRSTSKLAAHQVEERAHGSGRRVP